MSKPTRQPGPGDLPIFWKTGHGSNVWDPDGNLCVDFTTGYTDECSGSNCGYCGNWYPGTPRGDDPAAVIAKLETMVGR